MTSVALATPTGPTLPTPPAQSIYSVAIETPLNRVSYLGHQFLAHVNYTLQNTDGMYKLCKTIDAIFLATRVFLKDSCLAWVPTMHKRIQEVQKLIGVQHLAGRVNVFTSKEYLKKSQVKVWSTACLVVSKTCEFVQWSKSMGIQAAANIAKSFGSFSVFGRALALGSIKSSFNLAAAILSIADAYQVITKKEVESKLTIAYEVCKMGCILASAQFFTPGFAVLAITTNALAMSKLFYKAYKKGDL